MLYLLFIFPALALLGIAIVYTLPVFGAHPSGERLARIRASPHHDGQKFVHLEPTGMGTPDLRRLPEFFRRGKTIPAAPLPTLPLTPADFPRLPEDEVRVTWFGHSLLLVEMNGRRLLIDPVFSPVPSPFSFIGTPAFAMEHDYDLDSFPLPDAVLLSHDHYDHLDYPTIKKLARTDVPFICALGVGAHLERWGIAPGRITELDWWEATTFAGITITATPTRHFTGRAIKRFQTLWCGFALRSGDRNILYGGDSGYGIHGPRIGERLGPFDLAFVECGQYNEMWPDIHAFPEDGVKTWADVRADRIIPVHWGRFKLAMHDWNEPPQRLLAATPAADRPRVLTPRIGQRFNPLAPATTDRWYEDHQ